MACGKSCFADLLDSLFQYCLARPRSRPSVSPARGWVRIGQFSTQAAEAQAAMEERRLHLHATGEREQARGPGSPCAHGGAIGRSRRSARRRSCFRCHDLQVQERAILRAKRLNISSLHCHHAWTVALVAGLVDGAMASPTHCRRMSNRNVRIVALRHLLWQSWQVFSVLVCPRRIRRSRWILRRFIGRCGVANGASRSIKWSFGPHPDLRGTVNRRYGRRSEV